MKKCEFCGSKKVVVTINFWDDIEHTITIDETDLCAVCWNKVDFNKLQEG